VARRRASARVAANVNSGRARELEEPARLTRAIERGADRVVGGDVDLALQHEDMRARVRARVLEGVARRAAHALWAAGGSRAAVRRFNHARRGVRWPDAIRSRMDRDTGAVAR
jgi:hypothetical protein